jgi:hypothetical protein
MAGLAVATEGDVVVTLGTVPYQVGSSGLWSAGSVSYVSYAYLTVDGKKVISEASCGFSFSGKKDVEPHDPVVTPGPQSLKLSPPQPTLLQKGDAHVLRHGDTASDQWGNTLTVVTQNRLTSE